MYRVSVISTICVLGLTGCVEATLTGASALGLSVMQERSVGAAIDDTTILTQINSHYFQKDVNNLFQNVKIEVHEGRVLLTGTVTDPEYRVEAVRLAWQPQGVKEVINEITVKASSDTEDNIRRYAKDVWISTQIEGKLLLNTDIMSINYSVDTIEGVVYLMGIAQDEVELKEVQHIASTVSGVKKVISHVRMKDDPARF